MQVNTLIVGFVPLSSNEGKKPREIRDDTYFKELFAKFDLGTVQYASREDWRLKIDEINPLVIISLGGSYYAEDVQQYKKDFLLYAIDDAGAVFYRKAEAEEKKAKHIKVLSEIADIIQKVRDDGEEEVENVRKFAAMSYKDMYDMITFALRSEDKKLQQQAWDLLFGEGEKHSNFIWMRVQVMAELWEHASWKVREELMCMSMEHHIEQGTARKMDNFTDEDGLEYHQYMFLDPYGNDIKYIRRIPFATKDQEKISYENLLEKWDIPTNYLRVQMEANALRDHYDKHLAAECAKVRKVLEEWEKDPTKTKKELDVMPWYKGDEENPLDEEEVGAFRDFLKKHDTAS